MRLLVILLVLGVALPAHAHRLKVFVTQAPDGTLSGYAFFVGGGRPEGATFHVMDAAGAVVHQGVTGPGGRYSWQPAVPGAYTVAVDVGDGHVATTGAQAQVARPTALTEAQLRAAVQAEVAPLLDRIEAMDARMRLTDALSGVFLLLGLTGMALWWRRRA